MKQLVSLFLVGVLSTPLSGCGSSETLADPSIPVPEQCSNASDASSEYLSERICDLYFITINSVEQQIAALSQEITTLPVQSRPPSEEQIAAHAEYDKLIVSIKDAISENASHAKKDFASGNLTQDNFDAISFQFEQQLSHIDLLHDALEIVYGVYADSISAILS